MLAEVALLPTILEVSRDDAFEAIVKSPRITGILFYGLIAIWVLGIAIGLVARLPYMGKHYGGITLPIYGGLILLVMTVSDFCTGLIWRGRARAIDRQLEPGAYWVSLGVLALTGSILMWIGIRNWLNLQ